MKKKKLNKLFEIIDKHKKIMLLTHIRPDGDAVASSIAMAVFLTRLDKDVYIPELKEFPENYSFLKTNFNNKKIDNPSLVIFLDCGAFDRISDKYKKIIKNRKTVNIDHHHDNTEFADLNIVDSLISSTAELLYNIIKKYDKKVNLPEIFYKSIYTGISTDTGNLSFSNAKSNTFLVLSEIMKVLENPSKLYKKIYCSKPLKKIKFTGLILDRIKTYFNNKLTISYIKKEDYKEYNIQNKDLEGIVDYIGEVKDVEVYVLIKQQKKDECRLSLRSHGNYSVSKMTEFIGNGGGHKFAAGTTVYDNIENTIDLIKNYWRKIL